MEAWMKSGIKGRRDVSVTAIVDRVRYDRIEFIATAR
jgi:hypothetical protein